MDEQRLQAYVNLVETLLKCPEKEIVLVLQAQRSLVDAGLLEVMEQYAAHLESQGNGYAEWLRELAAQLEQALRLEMLGAAGAEAVGQFLLEALQLAVNSQGDPQQVYSVWAQQLDQFNSDLLAILPPVTSQLLSGEPEHRILVATGLFLFSNLIQQFPLGERWLNVELAIAAYQQALSVRTQAAMPFDWAITMNNLASAYVNRIRGDRADNIEQAIAAYQYALTVRTQATMPFDWAITLNGLAAAYTERIRGDKAENIETAIAANQQALTVITQATMPIEWAAIVNNLANAYHSRSRGDKAENIETAIAAYQQALTVRTQATMPFDWAITMSNLANAYAERIQGDKAENIETAIAAYQHVLTVRTQATMPFDWAITMNNLANTYRIRVRGNKAHNIEDAIATYQQVLTVITQATMPVMWAQTMTNLGLTYAERIQGDKAENVETAIAAYQQALTVITQSTIPIEWAKTMMNLANAYVERIRGDKAQNIETAITAYQQALTVITQSTIPVEWAKTMMNLGTAYVERLQGDKAQNIEQAIAAYQQAFTVTTQVAIPIEWAKTMMNLGTAYVERLQGDKAQNIEQAIASYQQALTVTAQTVMPIEWATTMHNLANAFRIRLQGDKAQNIEQAIATYQASLEVFEPELLPSQCRRTARSLGNLYSEQRRWAEAIPIYQKALQAAELLYQRAGFLDGKAAELAETADLPRRAAYALARSGDLEAAVLTLEQGRARSLSETLDRDRADLHQLQSTHPYLYQQYLDITQQFRNLETQQRLRMTSSERHDLTSESFRSTVQQLRHNLTETIEQIRQISDYEGFLAQPSFEEIRRATQPDNPLVYLVSTLIGSLALILTPDGIFDLWLNDLTEAVLVDLLVNTWFKAYAQSKSNHQVWLDAIESVTRQLWEPLMAPLMAHLKQQQFQQATLIPTGYLSFLPLHAAWCNDLTMPTGKRYVLDEILFTYTPNARSLTAAEAIASGTTTEAMLVIDNPVKDLPNCRREVEGAIATFPQHKILEHEEATVEAVLAALPNCSVLHLSCHGTAKLDEPLNSGLAMSNGLLTLRNLLDLKLTDDERTGIRLVVLSACETGLIGMENADEAIGLPTGLLQAGVAGVIASLWAVSDRSTMMLLVRFYDLWRKEKLEPSVALQRAQQWLRDSTDGEKEAYFPEFFALNQGDRSYAHPFHWAAFSYTGV